jgi:cytochrome oxidase assembly protein ShyY1
VLRTALKPRWLALLALVLVAAAVMARLGEWQLGRAREQGERDRLREAAARPVVPVTSLLPARTVFPAAAADRRVTAQGRWDAARQVLVPGRSLDGTTGFWVLTPLRLPDGSAVPVVRGWTADPGDARAAGAADPAALPAGDVTVQGVLEPSEPADGLRPGDVSGMPAGQVPLVSAPLLVQRWPYPLLTGYVVQTASTPAPAATAGARLRPVPPPAPRAGVAWQNLSYALQWWLFSLFGFFFWYRLVRDDARGVLRRPAAPGAADPADARPAPIGDDERDQPDQPDQPDRPALTPDAGGRP